MTKTYNRPIIFNAFKPAKMSSVHVVSHFKKNLPQGFGKIGHFGTLDPFASGVLMMGVNGAARLNEFIHEFLPKTYLAIGKLGVETQTGDLTIPPSQIDNSQYLSETIAKFDMEFIENFIKKEFLGDYWQAPHIYSAAKYEGKALHQWARAGVEIKKEKKLRQVYYLEVVKFAFPYLIIRCQVSSGTYIRTLFSDIANRLGTIGSLVSLVRESVGPCTIENAIKKSQWPLKQDWDLERFGMDVQDVLPFGEIHFPEKEALLYANGVPMQYERKSKLITSPLSDKYFWIKNNENRVLGLGLVEDKLVKTQVNFS